MKESEYILVSNLAQATTAESILRDMQVAGLEWQQRAKVIIALDLLIELIRDQMGELEEG